MTRSIDRGLQSKHREGESSGQGTLHFVVDAALLFQLGEELVTKRSVALSELIKNAYDADATRVAVTFESVKTPHGTIVVSDNGTGMTFKQIKSAWMRIATTSKARDEFSPNFKRPRAGAKGIGRFAARRLASSLTLISVAYTKSAQKKRRREETVVVFKWSDFKPGSEVEAIPVSYTRRRVPPTENRRQTGTKLVLSRVRDAWTDNDFESLTHDLSRLLSPQSTGVTATRGTAKDPGIAIQIKADEFPIHSGDVREQSLASALAVLDGRLASNGSATYTLKFRDSRVRKRFTPQSRFSGVGPVRFRIHFFVYRKDYFAGVGLNVRDAARRGRDEGGVQLYMDRFRIPPFGDPGDDWLKLDEDRGRRVVEVSTDLTGLVKGLARPMLFLPGNNQVFGRVQLSRVANPGIRQTLNREGVLETPAFRNLRTFVRTGINYLTVAYAREFESKRKKAREKVTSDTPMALLARARSQVVAASSDIPKEQQAQILQAIDIAQSAVQIHKEDVIGELSMLRVLASTGTMLVVFEHQLLGTLSGLRESHETLSDLVRDLPEASQRKLRAELTRLDKWIESAHHQGELLGLLVARKARSHRRRLAIKPVVDALKVAFDSYTDSYGISLTNELPVALKTPPMFEAELSAILVNLLTNAFKAVREQPERRVLVTGSTAGRVTTIVVKDTGVGADKKRWEEFFQPFVGESEPDPILGEGTGLGLKIVRDFVGVYGGEACFIAPEKPWHTAIKVTLQGD